MVLARTLRLVEAIDECPESIELERAAEAGTPEAIAAFLDRAGRSLRRFDVRIASVAALDGLMSYFVEFMGRGAPDSN